MDNNSNKWSKQSRRKYQALNSELFQKHAFVSAVIFEENCTQVL